MDSPLVSTEDLKRWTGYNQSGHVKNFLRRYGIRYYEAKNGDPVTTMAAVESANIENRTTAKRDCVR